jgi:hypothetical protein
LNWSIIEILRFLFREPAIYYDFLCLVGVISVISCIGYFFNQWQMRIKWENEREERKAMKERMERRRLR